MRWPSALATRASQPGVARFVDTGVLVVTPPGSEVSRTVPLHLASMVTGGLDAFLPTALSATYYDARYPPTVRARVGVGVCAAVRDGDRVCQRDCYAYALSSAVGHQAHGPPPRTR